MSVSAISKNRIAPSEITNNSAKKYIVKDRWKGLYTRTTIIQKFKLPCKTPTEEIIVAIHNVEGMIVAVQTRQKQLPKKYFGLSLIST